MGRPRKTGEPVKTTRKPRAKKVEEPEVKTEQIEDPVIDKDTEEDIPDLVEDPTPEPTKPSNSGTPYKVVNINSYSFLRIRSGPGTNYEIIGKLFNNNDVTVYETRNGWAKISENNEQWCSMDFLKKI